MSGITFLRAHNADIPTPISGKVTVFFSIEEGGPAYKDDTGAVFPLEGPAGATGPSGPAIHGLDGADAELLFVPGPTGNTGPIGSTGATGAAGPAGPIGFGMDGADGEYVPGIPGPQGNIGVTGAQGPPGSPIVMMDDQNYEESNVPMRPSSSGSTSASADETRLLPKPTLKRWAFVQPLNGTQLGVGIATATPSGAASFTDATGTWERFNSSTSGVVCTWGFNNIFGWPDANITLIARVRTGSDLTNVRIFLGAKTNDFTNADTLSSDGITFRYSTVAGDGGWIGVNKNAGGQSVTGTIAAIAVDTTYILKFVVSGNGTNVAFSVNGGTPVNLTTNIPIGSALTGKIAMIPQAAVSKTFYVSALYMEDGE